MTSGQAASHSYRPIVPAVTAMLILVTAISFLSPLLIPISNDLGITLAEASQLVVAATIAWAAAAPFCGLLSDRVGRRPVIVTGLIGMGLTTLAGAYVDDIRVLLILRVLTGVFGSATPPSVMAGIGDLFPPHRQGTAAGWINTGISLAPLVGVPVVGAIGGVWGWRAAFQVTGLALFGAALLMRFGFPAGRRGAAGSGNPLRAYAFLFRLPGLRILLVANTCDRITFMAVALYYASFLIQTYGLTPVTVAPALAIAASGAIAGNLLGSRLADRWPPVRVPAAGLILSAMCGLGAFAAAPSPILPVLAAFGFGVANGVSRTGFVALLMGLTDRHRGALSGLQVTSNQAGWGLGAALGGLAFGWLGYPGLSFQIVGFALLGAVLVLRVPRGAHV